MKKIFLIAAVILAVFTACNKDWSFPDYKYTTVYFPYQAPVRTLVLGNYIYDNSLDNQHKCQILATMGGVYSNKKDVTLSLSLDTSLASHLKFETSAGDNVVAMPSSYYTLPKDLKIVIPSGSVQGGIEVQLTDAFFADPLSVKNTYVIPLRITSVSGADSILRGKSDLASPDSRKPADWVITPKNYVLFAIKYINQYHGVYLRRGVEVVKGNSGNTALDTLVTYHAPYVEQDQLCNVVTTSLTQGTMALNAKNRGNINAAFQMVLNFDNNGKCTITNPANVTYTLTGTGEFVKGGDMWGNEKRDVLHLSYQVNFGTTTHSFTDTVVVRDRGVKMETFNPFVTP